MHLFKLMTTIIYTNLMHLIQCTVVECRYAAQITYNELAYVNADVRQHTSYHFFLNIY